MRINIWKPVQESKRNAFVKAQIPCLGLWELRSTITRTLQEKKLRYQTVWYPCPRHRMVLQRTVHQEPKCSDAPKAELNMRNFLYFTRHSRILMFCNAFLVSPRQHACRHTVDLRPIITLFRHRSSILKVNASFIQITRQVRPGFAVACYAFTGGSALGLERRQVGVFSVAAGRSARSVGCECDERFPTDSTWRTSDDARFGIYLHETIARHGFWPLARHLL